VAFPKKQYVLARKRGRKTSYFYGDKLKDLYCHIKPGEEFRYATLTTSQWNVAYLTERGTVVINA
jgi:hypothetical protein